MCKELDPCETSDLWPDAGSSRSPRMAPLNLLRARSQGGCWGLLSLCGGAPPRGGASGLTERAIASTTTFQVDQRHPTFPMRWVPLIAFGVSTRYVTVAE